MSARKNESHEEYLARRRQLSKLPHRKAIAAERMRGLLCDSCNICAGHIESSRYEKVKAYLARQRRPGWDCWGNETDKFAESAT